MRASIRSSMASHFAGAVAAIWLCGAGAARAGDGGDLGSLQAIIGPPDGSSGFCATLGMTNNNCPQLPTITQAVLEAAGLSNSPPEMVRAQNNIAPGSSVTAGNAAAVPPDDPLPLDSMSTPTLADLLSTLTPLAFTSQNSGTAEATQLFDPNADAFLYAVGVSSLGATNAVGLTVADTAYFFYDDLFRNNRTFNNNQVVAKFSFPLTVLNTNGTENPPVMITLQVKAICSGGPTCLKAQIVGGIGTPQNPVDASQLGIQFALVFSASPTSTQQHAIFEVAVPLLVTGACVGANPQCIPGEPQPPPNTDPAYFSFLHTTKPGPINTATFTAFGSTGDALGATPTQSGILPTGAFSIGLAPTAALPCVGKCPTPLPVPIPFALCATLPDNSNGPGAKLRPAVGAYYAIATGGEMLLSAPLPSVSTSFCPQL
jgi:hypothetical protein